MVIKEGCFMICSCGLLARVASAREPPGVIAARQPLANAPLRVGLPSAANHVAGRVDEALLWGVKKFMLRPFHVNGSAHSYRQMHCVGVAFAAALFQTSFSL